jgi:actin-related protein 9
MTSQTGKWREEQVLIICPGSQTTMAQVGCGELKPPAWRVPTRMFRDEESDDWRPHHIYKRRKGGRQANGTADGVNGDDEDDFEWAEDPDSSEGAVFPIQGEQSCLPISPSGLRHERWGSLTT